MRPSDLRPADAELRDPANPKWFRQVLAQYPTGVCVISALGSADDPVGMSVGSFTSVSLEPPLVAFFPHRGSTTWPKIRAAGRFCVNILGAEQESVCRRFAQRSGDRYAGLPFRLSALGSPILEDSVAWIDCELHSEQEAGDHYIVIGRVRELQIESGGLPLLFYQGGYGRFSPLSMTAVDPLGLISKQLRNAEMARPEMERMAAELDSMCVALARVDDEIVVAASAGRAHRHSVATLVGQRLPSGPPFGALFEPREGGYRLGTACAAADGAHLPWPARESGHEVDLREMLQHLSYEASGAADAGLVRLISVPVLGLGGDIVLALALSDLPQGQDAAGLRGCIDRAVDGARIVTERIAGSRPA